MIRECACDEYAIDWIGIGGIAVDLIRFELIELACVCIYRILEACVVWGPKWLWAKHVLRRRQLCLVRRVIYHWWYLFMGVYIPSLADVSSVIDWIGHWMIIMCGSRMAHVPNAYFSNVIQSHFSIFACIVCILQLHNGLWYTKLFTLYTIVWLIWLRESLSGYLVDFLLFLVLVSENWF